MAVRAEDSLAAAWVPLTVAINSVNRSSQPDLYPFVLSPPVVGKLEFIWCTAPRRSPSGARDGVGRRPQILPMPIL